MMQLGIIANIFPPPSLLPDPQVVINQQVGVYGVVFGAALIVFGVLWVWKKYRMKK